MESQIEAGMMVVFASRRKRQIANGQFRGMGEGPFEVLKTGTIVPTHERQKHGMPCVMVITPVGNRNLHPSYFKPHRPKRGKK